MLTRTSVLLLAAGVLATVVTLSPPASSKHFGFPQPSPAVTAPGAASGIQVLGVGTIEVAPEEVVVSLRIRARENSPLESHTAFEERRILFDKAMAAFDDVLLRVESRGVTIDIHTAQNQVFINGQMEQSAPFETKEVVHATMQLGEDDSANIKLVSELIQAAVDVECSIDIDDANPWNRVNRGNEPGAIRYRLSREGLVAARDQAMAAAMADARQQAESLARLAGRALGPVDSVSVKKPFPANTDVSGKSERSLTLSVGFLFAE